MINDDYLDMPFDEIPEYVWHRLKMSNDFPHQSDYEFWEDLGVDQLINYCLDFGYILKGNESRSDLLELLILPF